MNFICGPCKDQEHEKCPGGSWCDCHHRISARAREALERVLRDHDELFRRLA